LLEGEMRDALNRLVMTITAIPGRVLRAAGWASTSGTNPYREAEDVEAERRREGEAWRQGVDETDPPQAN
jgi:hypothetical protein